MILGFKTVFPWGEPTNFKKKILGKWEKVSSCSPSMQVCPGTKLHTIRAGNRFNPGDILHMATGVRTKNYNQFNKGISSLEKVVAVQEIKIYSDIKEVWVEKQSIDRNVYLGPLRKLSVEEVEQLAINDGFDSIEQFWKWFTTDLSGQIIFWVDKKY